MPFKRPGSACSWMMILTLQACAWSPGSRIAATPLVVRPAGDRPGYPGGAPKEPEVQAGEVAGCVLERGHPVEGVNLSLVEERTWKSTPVRTDVGGYFRHRFDQPGRYHVHYYNDRDNDRVGYWKSRTLVLARGQAGIWPAWDVHLKGMRNDPAPGAAIRPPLRVRIEPHPQALRVWFRLHDRGGPGGQAFFVSPTVPGTGRDRYTYPVEATRPGFQLWGYQWDAGAAGEGGCLFQDVTVAPQ